MTTKILIVDDHPITRSGIKSILDFNASTEIVGEAEDGIEAISLVSKLKPEIVLMDISMPKLSGVEATRKILDLEPDTKIIAFSIHSSEKFVKEMLDAGASGYLLKEEAPEELIKGIEKVQKGDMFLSSAITRIALKKEEKEEEPIKYKVLFSKFHRPQIMADYILRTKVIQKLESNAIKPFSLISAGAGYGKSIAVSQWIEQTQYPTSWISLDSEQNDMRIFLSYLVMAINKLFPDSMANTGLLITAPSLPPAKEISHTLINEMCDLDEDFILVLDDYHKITRNEIHLLIDQWLLFPPPCAHLCMITRRDPPMELKSLKLADRVTEIRMEDLSFSNTEIVELFQQSKNMDLSNDSVNLIQQKTEGWIIALRLTSLIVDDSDELKKTFISLKGGIHSVFDYLLQEVFNKQPEHIQDLLLMTSILNRFCVELIDEIGDKQAKSEDLNFDRKEFISWLNRFNLFIISLDSDQKWFRYHHLFQDFLQMQLKVHKNKNDIKNLNIRASQWFENNKYLTEAIEYAIKGNDNDRAIRIIKENWEQRIENDEWIMVDHWISSLPEKTISQSVNLLLAKIWIEMRRHQINRFPALIEQIEKSSGELSKGEKGHLEFAKCPITYFTGDPEKASQHAQRALKLIPEKYACFLSDTAGWHTPILISLGKGDRAIEIADEAIKVINSSSESVQLTRRMMHPNFVYITRADLPSLKERIERFFKISDISSYMLGFGWYFKGAISWWGFDQHLAIQSFTNCIDHRFHSVGRQAMDSYICLALSLQEMNNGVEAERVLREGIEFAQDIGDQVSISVGFSGKARLNLLNGDLDKAEEWLNQTEPNSLDYSMLWWVEVPEITRCRILIARGAKKDLQSAVRLLEEYRLFSESIYNSMRTIDILVLESLVFNKLGQEDEALKNLKTAIQLSAPGEWIRPFAESIHDISDQLLELKKQAVNPGFIDKIYEVVEKVRKVKEQVTEGSEQLRNKTKQEKLTALTASELKVLECMAKGLRNKEIADKLFNSEETIKKHIYHMFQKFQVKNRLSLVSKAKEEGILH